MLVAVSKGMQAVKLVQQNPPVLNWWCRLTQVDMCNGRKMVVVGLIVLKLLTSTACLQSSESDLRLLICLCIKLSLVELMKAEVQSAFIRRLQRPCQAEILKERCQLCLSTHQFVSCAVNVLT